MTGELTVGSLFSGIGGLELGLERAGMRVIWQVEKDEYCRRVLAKHWPKVMRYSDVRDVGGDWDGQNDLAHVDAICGGFPCQDISAAGKRIGIRGERSGLWSEYARIVREIRPRYVLVENVSALLVRGLDVVLGDLAESGYDAEWFVLSAADVGAPHLRERVFILAYPASDLRRAPWNDRPQSPDGRHSLLAHAASKRLSHRRSASVGESGSITQPERRSGLGNADIGSMEGQRPSRLEVTHTRSGETQPQGSGDGAWEYWATEPDVGRVANGVPRRVDRLRALGNAVVPQVSEYIGRLIVEADKEMVGAA